MNPSSSSSSVSGLQSKQLKEEDVPGASLLDRDPSLLKIPELKRWLQCRNASTRGKKTDLILRLIYLLIDQYNYTS